jgi:hypothetical protein
VKFLQSGKFRIFLISVLAVIVVLIALLVFKKEFNIISDTAKNKGYQVDKVANTTSGQAVPTGINAGPGGPILIISSFSNPLSLYYAEILRTEGFNEFDVCDISSLSPALLASHDIVILGEMPLTISQVRTLGEWVKGGGHLIAMRPDKKLAGLLGLTDLSSTISDSYLLVNTSSVPGAGIVDKTIQYHGTADVYGLNGASSIATLCSDAVTRTSNPLVTLNNVGTKGGQAAAFAYSLARSVVYTRQGNPAWTGQERDGRPPIRSDDLFYGNAAFDPEPDWVDLNKVAIPQADEQQRLLANLIIRMNIEKKPLPRFWYFPRSLPAVIVMTGDDHGSLYRRGATADRFNQFLALSPKGCVVDNWECIRGTSYLFPTINSTNPLSNGQAADFVADGFEISVHIDTIPDCSDWTFSSLASAYDRDLKLFASKYPSVPAPETHRMHCASWCDYDSQPKIELSHGIRLDTNYYYWPPKWVRNQPGMFTGSGMPMRFADRRGNMIDVYQAATQMTDESGQTYPFTVDKLLDRAVGPEGYYGAFVINLHNDEADLSASDMIIHSAMKRGIPVISVLQLLKWVDGRNASAFNSLHWENDTLSFSVFAAKGAIGLVAMVPVTNGHNVTGIRYNGKPITFKFAIIKGIRYAMFKASTGAYKIDYTPKSSAPGFFKYSLHKANRWFNW